MSPPSSTCIVGVSVHVIGERTQKSSKPELMSFPIRISVGSYPIGVNVQMTIKRSSVTRHSYF